jgi:hypothetical protein
MFLRNVGELLDYTVPVTAVLYLCAFTEDADLVWGKGMQMYGQLEVQLHAIFSSARELHVPAARRRGGL